jgi:hypothetical protein
MPDALDGGPTRSARSARYAGLSASPRLYSGFGRWCDATKMRHGASMSATASA